MPEEPGKGSPEVILAIDFGLRRIGLAVGDTLTGHARPLCTLQVPRERAPGAPEIQRVGTEARAAGAARIVAGCPYNADGSEHALAGPARAFARAAAAAAGLPVHLVDERHSSLEAASALRERRVAGMRRGRVTKPDVDGAAAAVILERWMAGEGDR